MMNNKTRGEEHWNWKGGRSEQLYRKLMANAQIPAICIDCGKVDKLQIHHKNENHEDNRVDNLEFVCPKCHRKRHPTIYTEERRQKQSIDMMGEKNPNFGNRWTKEQKKTLSEKLKGKPSWITGKHQSEETKKKLSEIHRGKSYSPKTQFKKGMVPWWKKRGYNSVKEAINASP